MVPCSGYIHICSFDLFSIRFREVSPDDSNIDSIAPEYFRKKEIIYFRVNLVYRSTILVLYLTFIAWQSMITVWVDPYSEEGADDAFDITIEAYQWGWNFIIMMKFNT